MDHRRTRIYELDITYPPGAHTPGWHPPGWRPSYPGERFAWPRYHKRSLSHRTARRRADHLESLGAYVTVRASNPVTWPSTPTEAHHAEHLADQVAVLRVALEAERAEVRRWRTLYEGAQARADRLSAP